MFPKICAAFQYLQEADEIKKTGKYNLIKSQRQPPNLKKLLAQAKYSNKDKFYSKLCNRLRCGYCQDITEANFHKFRTRADMFYLKADKTCVIANLICITSCSMYKEGYIERQDKEKLNCETWVLYIENILANLIVSSLSVRNILEPVE